MESPIIVCSHQNDRRVANPEDALPKGERMLVAALLEEGRLPVVVLFPGPGCSDCGR